MTDIRYYYNNSEAVKEYVDKYAIKHNLSTEEALKHIMVDMYISWMLEKNLL